ncbi:hypothetical protein GOARA_006_00440 [Gordonia araii NBRC 100433]|uniref:Luciferase-like domain-containing protein n=1 Tax=Gordonia araii NBRC 100433 TaxID=1073574 RepID=G7GXG0_9ACTN|nr:TIGR03619 family F420-dependent LLM class oxidoreductase [Gordonia araii]NNG95929.1 TIGR03619 family F420-dependent LLM class oxidoreductase [Gordonia araii NBRC 100433]GAB08285.1 hypothetical protein GOARA_006_00440 [Gordonia araii NBRC 100433]
MRLGLSTPIVTAQPGLVNEWELTAGPDELVRVAQAADDLGYDHLTCSEHVGVPAADAAERGGVYWDPLATLSFLAAHTRRIRLATSVLVLGYHQPLAIAKRYGTLDVLSGGRLVLGVGVGSLAPEFDLLGADWAGRGAVADERLVQLRAWWGRGSVDGFTVEPHATSTTPTIWVGGRTRRSLRRAVEFGAGWVPFGLGGAQLREFLAAAEAPPGFEVLLSPGPLLDPAGDADGVRSRLARLRDLGATVAVCKVAGDDVAHYCDQLAALHEIAEAL